MEKEVLDERPISLVRSIRDQFLHSGTSSPSTIRASSSGSRSSSATGYEAAAAAAAAAQFAYQQHLSGGIMNQSVRSHRESSAFVPVQPSRSIPVSFFSSLMHKNEKMKRKKCTNKLINVCENKKKRS